MAVEERGKASGKIFAQRYELFELLGKGGMAEVYRARDTSLGSLVALKILHGHLSSNEVERERFLREARITRKINHQNVVRTFDVGESQGRPFFVMELLEGVTLKQIIESEGALPISEAIAIAEKILSGLESVHQAGVIHKDIKPSNVVFTKPSDTRTTGLRLTEKKFGLIKLTDFGVAREIEDLVDGEDEMVGSAPYMPPESWKKLGVSQASDLYAFGAMFFEMITGHPPFEGESSFELMAKHYEEPVPTATSPHGNLPVWVQGYIEKLLAKNAQERFRNASEALSVLFQATSNPDEVEITSCTAVTITNYKRSDYVIDDQSGHVEQVVSDESQSGSIMSKSIAVSIYIACSYALFSFLVEPQFQMLMESSSVVSLMNFLPIVACYCAILSIPMAIVTTIRKGLVRGIIGIGASSFMLTIATLVNYFLISFSTGIAHESIPAFFHTKQGKITYLESVSRVSEVVLLLPPNSIGQLFENKKTLMEKRSSISTITQMLILYVSWSVVFFLVGMIFFGGEIPFGAFLSAGILISAGFIESYTRSQGIDVFGRIIIDTPYAQSISILSFICACCAFWFVWWSFGYGSSKLVTPSRPN